MSNVLDQPALAAAGLFAVGRLRPHQIMQFARDFPFGGRRFGSLFAVPRPSLSQEPGFVTPLAVIASIRKDMVTNGKK